MSRVRIAAAILIALGLAGCAGQGLSPGNSTPAGPAAPDVTMAGRWRLSAPNAPSCGMNFTINQGSPGGRAGTVVPEGGCPGRFFTSRHWVLQPGALTINDDENNPLAQLNSAGGHFEGKSAEGVPVTLAR